MSGWMIAVVTVGGTLPLQKVRRAGNPEFDARFDVETDSPRLAADVLVPATRNWLVHDESARNWGFRIHDDWLYVNAFTRTDQVDELLDALCPLFDRLPDTVRGQVH